MPRDVLKDGATASDADAMTDFLIAVGHRQDRHAFVSLFQYYAPRLKTYMRKLGSPDAAADDLVQEAMLTVWRKAHTFNPDKASAGTWIFTIARNLRIDRLRREGRPEYDPDDPLLVVDSPAAVGAEEQVMRRRSDDLMRKAVRDLPEDQAMVVRLSYYEECPHVEIAQRLGVPLGTVKSRLRLAMNRLRTALGDHAE